MDNASSEYIFTIEFFLNNHSKKINETVGGAFNEIFDGTIKLVQVTNALISTFRILLDSLLIIHTMLLGFYSASD